jgi:hypothetical protein
MERLLSAVQVLRRPLVLVLAAVCVGAALRLVWVRDMEWKLDEPWIYEHCRQVQHWSDLSWMGLPSSVGVTNPGMSLWVFIGLMKAFDVQEPTGLARAVQICNIAALFLLVWFACRLAPATEREPWLWAAALVAVNPLAVLLQRKIWPPSVLPLLTTLVLCGWERRSRPWGAFLWGFVAVCMGQIHMSGFFFAAGFALWALLFDRRGVAWGGWLAGSALAALPMVPWLAALLTEHGPHSVAHDNWIHALECKFWMRWVQEPFGLGIDYTLEDQFRDFLTYPHVLGRPTYLVALLHGVAGVLALALFVRLGRSLWAGRRELWRRFTGTDSPGAFTQNAALWGYGLVLTASCCSLHRHYMAILFPLEFLWLARLALGRPDAPPAAVRRGRVCLAVLWAVQLLLSIQFLQYVHVRQRIDGEYGPTYASQQAAPRP